uniref:Mce/MlaD domain-containing protein n=1 Tax=Opuntia streptacantha TaxID=393608 RepID=A0A7C9EQ98_OPUST
MVRNMVSNRFIQAPIKSTGLAYPSIQIRHCPENSLPCLPSRCPKRVVFIKAVSANSENNQPPSSWEAKAPLSAALDVPCSIWKQALHPLSDLGFGRRNIWEGGVGIFIVSSTLLLALGFSWLKGYQIRSKFRKYFAVFEFPHASGICTGTPVRIRGVNVGNVIRVNPSLKNIEAVVEVDNDKVIIPRNSFVEINQSGLLMESKRLRDLRE